MLVATFIENETSSSKVCYEHEIKNTALLLYPLKDRWEKIKKIMKSFEHSDLWQVADTSAAASSPLTHSQIVISLYGTRVLEHSAVLEHLLMWLLSPSFSGGGVPRNIAKIVR